MGITVTGTNELKSRLDALGMRTKFAAMKAADDTANRIMHVEREEMKKVFNNPTDWALRGVQMTNANPDNPVASVYISNKQGAKGQGLSQTPRDVLAPHIYGGSRTSKAIELYLRQKGVLPADKYLGIGRGAWVDSHGNIPGSEISALLSQLNAYPESLNMNGTGRKFKNFKYFVFSRNGVPLGIMAREKRSGGVQPIFVFISRPTYKQVFDYFGLAQSEVRNTFRIFFYARLNP